jgi:hypothetical protein
MEQEEIVAFNHFVFEELNKVLRDLLQLNLYFLVYLESLQRLPLVQIERHLRVLRKIRLRNRGERP